MLIHCCISQEISLCVYKSGHKGSSARPKGYLTNAGFHSVHDVPLLLLAVLLCFTYGSDITLPRHFNPVISPPAFVLLPSPDKSKTILANTSKLWDKSY